MTQLDHMKKTAINFIKLHKIQLLIAAVSLFCYAVFVYASRHYFTYDTVMSQVGWWTYLNEHGWRGIATLNDSGADYTTIWYFVIVVFTKLGFYPQFPIEYSIKFMAVATSVLSAMAIYFIAKQYHKRSQYLPVIAASITPFLAMFSMDLLKTNLTDGMYLSLGLWSFYFFVKNKKGLAWFLLAFGACFKLMAIYIAPVYAFFYIKDFRKYTLKEKLAPLWGILAVFIASIPNVLAGGKILDGIITPIIGRNEAGVVMPWFWTIPVSNNFTPVQTAHDMRFMLFGLIVFVFFFTFFFLLKYIKRENQTTIGLAILPTLSIMICYYFLPSQHETYFAMAGVFALVGFLIIPKKELFINFLAINIFLYYMYLFGITWWYDEPVWIISKDHMGLVFLSLIGFNYYIIYKYSLFYRPQKTVKG